MNDDLRFEAMPDGPEEDSRWCVWDNHKHHVTCYWATQAQAERDAATLNVDWTFADLPAEDR